MEPYRTRDEQREYLHSVNREIAAAARRAREEKESAARALLTEHHVVRDITDDRSAVEIVAALGLDAVQATVEEITVESIGDYETSLPSDSVGALGGLASAQALNLTANVPADHLATFANRRY